MGARDDEHGRRANECRLGVAEQRPHSQGEHAGDERHVEEGRGGTVGEDLRARLGCLRLGHEPHDSREGGVVANGRDADAEAAPGRDGAGNHRVAGLLGDGARLTADHRFVDVGRAFDDGSVGGHAASGPDEHDVVFLEFADADLLDAGIGQALGLIGQEGSQRRQRALRLHD